MSAASVPQKKSALCRYFASSGTCFYGDNCQFTHAGDTNQFPPEKLTRDITGKFGHIYLFHSLLLI